MTKQKTQEQKHHRPKKRGGAGYRSLCLLHAKQTLYHLSYTPESTSRSYGVVVSISGCDPLDPGSTPGTATLFPFFLCSPCQERTTDNVLALATICTIYHYERVFLDPCFGLSQQPGRFRQKVQLRPQVSRRERNKSSRTLELIHPEERNCRALKNNFPWIRPYQA